MVALNQYKVILIVPLWPKAISLQEYTEWHCDTTIFFQKNHLVEFASVLSMFSQLFKSLFHLLTPSLNQPNNHV